MYQIQMGIYKYTNTYSTYRWEYTNLNSSDPFFFLHTWFQTKSWSSCWFNFSAGDWVEQKIFRAAVLSPYYLNLTISCRWIFLSRTYACFEGNIFVQEKKTNILKIKMTIKNVLCCFNTKTQYSFNLDCRDVGKEVRGKWGVGRERVPK